MAFALLGCGKAERHEVWLLYVHEGGGQLEPEKQATY
jgi:hypothetical protein